ncbi:MAG: PRC-barrel domain-containing protein [Patescibacteria group bacterium]|nr:PRC-barrel domain-containing protein [Patescibacteria group bacterium]
MVLQNKELIKLPVYTKSNTHLGYITHFDVDELEQKIARYYVKTHQGIVGLFDQELIILPGNVISLTVEKMVVEDGVIKELVEKEARMASKGVVPASG